MTDVADRYRVKKILDQIRMKYETELVSDYDNSRELRIYCCSKRCNRVNIVVWKRDQTFGIYGDDDSLQGNESIPLDKLEDLLEIIL
ncbi:hypothetical protein FDJ20_gp116 [Vibrio phage Thalassa]|uniref:Uncharacterized protein n=1 Tax=Vibrio phage Thalassa TaxID=2570301 RepID=A0A2H5BHB7_9CAUD|nr:hypothetical protein FDJ20_gp116 [Vibrio phage Thalassa]AUG85386.1 hypothetical protein THALASSA_207 [Vibrio phage Thalassa]